MELSEELKKKIDERVGKYPTSRSAVLPLLHLIQEELLYIPDEAIEWVAQKLDIPPINVYEVVTFYPMLKRSPMGKKHVRVCRTLSCALRGSYQVCKTIQEELNVELDHTTEDGEYSLEFMECLASCGTAPVVMVNEEHYDNVDVDKAREICRGLKK